MRISDEEYLWFIRLKRTRFPEGIPPSRSQAPAWERTWVESSCFPLLTDLRFRQEGLRQADQPGNGGGRDCRECWRSMYRRVLKVLPKRELGHKPAFPSGSLGTRIKTISCQKVRENRMNQTLEGRSTFPLIILPTPPLWENGRVEDEPAIDNHPCCFNAWDGIALQVIYLLGNSLGRHTGRVRQANDGGRLP